MWGVRKITISIIQKQARWNKSIWVYLGWRSCITLHQRECASLHLMEHRYLRFRWFLTFHNKYPRIFVSLGRKISRGSLPRSCEPGAGQEIKELWRKGRFSGVRASIWEKHSWVWDHAHCGTGRVWALPLLQLTQSRSEGGEWHHLSYVEHKGGHNSLITEDSPGFSLWSPCCKAVLKRCTEKREIWDNWLVFITHIFLLQVLFFFCVCMTSLEEIVHVKGPFEGLSLFTTDI